MFSLSFSVRRSAPAFTRSLATPALGPVRGSTPRKIWQKEEVQAVYDRPLLDLVFQAASIHRTYHDPNKIQLCTLMNIKSEQLFSFSEDISLIIPL
jgi:biotin synthase